MVNIASDKGTVEVKVKKEESVGFTCLATGVGSDAFRYQWFLNNDPIPGQRTSRLVIQSVSEDNTGDYTCSVLNSFKGIGRSDKITLILGK